MLNEYVHYIGTNHYSILFIIITGKMCIRALYIIYINAYTV